MHQGSPRLALALALLAEAGWRDRGEQPAGVDRHPAYPPQLGPGQGTRAAIIGGLADGGGGNSVTAGDACLENGLKVPPLSFETKQKLSELLGEVGSILHNPVDISQAQFRGLATLSQAIDLVVRDTISDIVLIQEDIEILLPIYSQKGLEEINELIIELGRRQSKPVVVVLPPAPVEAERLRIQRKLLAASIPVFSSTERAAKAIYRLNQHCCRREAN